MIFFSNMELRNSFHRKSSEVGAVASMPSPRENIWNCLAVPSTAIAPTCQGQKNHGCHPVTSHIHISAAGSASTAASAAASAKEQPLRVFSACFEEWSHWSPKQNYSFTSFTISHKSQTKPRLPPNTVPSNGIWLQGFALHSGIASSARNSTRFDDFICEAVCEKLVGLSPSFTSSTVFAFTAMATASYGSSSFSFSFRYTQDGFFTSPGYQKHICSELLPRSSDFW